MLSLSRTFIQTSVPNQISVGTDPGSKCTEFRDGELSRSAWCIQTKLTSRIWEFVVWCFHAQHAQLRVVRSWFHSSRDIWTTASYIPIEPRNWREEKPLTPSKPVLRGRNFLAHLKALRDDGYGIT